MVADLLRLRDAGAIAAMRIGDECAPRTGAARSGRSAAWGAVAREWVCELVECPLEEVAEHVEVRAPGRVGRDRDGQGAGVGEDGERDRHVAARRAERDDVGDLGTRQLQALARAPARWSRTW